MKKSSLVALFSFSFLLINPVCSQPYQWFYDTLKKQGRHIILQDCSMGREYNAKGVSYWNRNSMKKADEALKRKGRTDEYINNSNAATAALMKEECPEVW